MSRLILPSVDFSVQNDLDTKHKKSIKIKIKPKIESESESESGSEIDIDEIDSLIYPNGYDSSSSESEPEQIIVKEPEIDDPPIYDGIEPYYLFNRRWDRYMNMTCKV